MYEQLKVEMCRVMQLVSTKGWSPGSSANLSVRVLGTNRVCIKSTGTSMAFSALDPGSGVVVIDLDGNVVEGDRKPSMEFRFHLGIYGMRSDVGAVLHAHPPYATSYAVANLEVPLVSSPGRFILKKVPLLRFASSGTPELAEIVTKGFEDPTVFSALLSGHGIVAVGRDLYEAFRNADWTEDAAQIAFLSNSLKVRGNAHRTVGPQS